MDAKLDGPNQVANQLGRAHLREMLERRRAELLQLLAADDHADDELGAEASVDTDMGRVRE